VNRDIKNHFSKFRKKRDCGNLELKLRRMNKDLSCHHIPDTDILVDWFRPLPPSWQKTHKSTIFFLSHFHGDHYSGLTDQWDKGEILCSVTTGTLAKRVIGVRADLIKTYSFNEPFEVFSPTLKGNVTVSLCDANHCPGAAMLIFHFVHPEKGPISYIHTGDFRYTPRLLKNIQLKARLEAIFLDTTYCHPKHNFVEQRDSIGSIIETISQKMLEKNKRTLVLLSAYKLGKERILLAVAKALGRKIFVDTAKLPVLECLGFDDEDMGYFTADMTHSDIHVCRMGFCGEMWPYFRPNFKNIKEYLANHRLEHDQVIAFIPTGWAGSSNYNKRNATRKKKNITIMAVPYSEHSNFSELLEFVTALKPVQVVPTVFSDSADRKRIMKRFSRVTDTKVLKKRFINAFKSNSNSSAEAPVSASDIHSINKSESDGVAMNGSPRRDHAASGHEDSIRPEIKQCHSDREAPLVAPMMGTENEVKVKAEPSEVEEHMTINKLKSTPRKRRRSPSSVASLTETPKRRQMTIRSFFSPSSDKGTCKRRENNSENERKQEQQQQNHSSSSGHSRKKPADDLNSVPASEVACRLCTFRNPLSAQRCEMCNMLLGSASEIPCPACTFLNPSAASRCEICSTALPPPQLHVRHQPKLSRNDRKNNGNGEGREKERESEKTSSPANTAHQDSVFSQDTEIQSSDSDSDHKNLENADKSDHDGPGPDKGDITLKGNNGKDVEASLSKFEKVESIKNKEEEPVEGTSLTFSSFLNKQGKSKGTASAFSVNFDSKLEDYDPLNPGGDGSWSEGKEAHYLYLAHMFEALTATTKRLRKLRILTNIMRTALRMTPDQLQDIFYLCTNDLSPSYEGVNLSIGGSTLSKAVMDCSGCSRSRMSELYKKHGDLGDVALACKSKQRTMFAVKPLTIRGVRQELLLIAGESGQGSQARKKKRILNLLTRCRSVEIRWIVRTICLHLRTGATRTSCLSALAQAKVLHDLQFKIHAKAEKSERRKLRKLTLDNSVKETIKLAQSKISDAYNRRPDLGKIIEVLIDPKADFSVVDRICITPGLPVCCMLANTTRSIDQILELQGDSHSVSQFKYDGQRAQIHLLESGEVKIFSRHNEDITSKYPDAIRAVQDALKSKEKKADPSGGREDNDDSACNNISARGDTDMDCSTTSFILDGEICGVERHNQNRLMAFQQLSTRAKKNTTEEGQDKVPVCFFVFDLLFANRISYIGQSFESRRRQIRSHFKILPGKFELAREKVCKTADEMKAFLSVALKAGTEGLVVKTLESPYVPGKRRNNWLKLKPDYSDAMGDSIDVVPIGAWWGNGRKAGWFSPFLLAVYDSETETYQTLCRCISGFTDEFYKTQTEFFKKQVIDPQPYTLRGEVPSIWFKPTQVWEIRGAELTVSPTHKAGEGILGHAGKGLSVRFPRFVRIREDRDVTDTTTPEQLVDLFNAQHRRL